MSRHCGHLYHLPLAALELEEASHPATDTRFSTQMPHLLNCLDDLWADAKLFKSAHGDAPGVERCRKSFLQTIPSFGVAFHRVATYGFHELGGVKQAPHGRFPLLADKTAVGCGTRFKIKLIFQTVARCMVI